MNRIIGFDIIRILAIGLIVVFHYKVVFDPIPFGKFFGSFGVILFFLLSGYLTRLSYNHNPNIQNYIKKRFLSIFPATWVVFILFYIVIGFYGHDFFYGGPFYRIIYSFLGIDGYLDNFYIDTYYITGEWFTGAILILYFLFPFLNRLMNEHPILGTVVIFIYYLISLYVIGNLKNPDGSPVVLLRDDQRPLITLFVFWLGMLLERLSNNSHFSYYLLIPTILGIVFCNFFPDLWTREYFRLFFCFCIFLTIIILTQDLVLPNGIVKTLNYLSMISFVIYLTHHQLIYILVRDQIGYYNSDLRFWGGLIFIIVLTIILSILIYELTGILINAANKVLSKRQS